MTMRKNISILLLCILFGTSCSNDFDLTTNWKDVTVVYGLLDPTQTSQYIRIEKAFLDESTSALTLAQNADSLYYNTLSVELEEIVLGGTGNVISLTRVDANLEGFQREDGIFATSPNYVYKTDEALNQDARYKLIINKDDGNQVTAETDIAQEFTITAPPGNVTELNFRTDNPDGTNVFRWTLEPNNKFFEFIFDIHIREAPLSDPTNFTDRTLKWVVNDNIVPAANESLVRVELARSAFHEFMASSLEEGFVREFVSMDMIVSAGGSDLLEYINVGQANAGITGADIVPIYTNLSEGGLGVLSTRISTSRTGFDINGLTLDSLQNGYRTRNLGF